MQEQPQATTGFQKYVFKATASALSGSVRTPYFQLLGDHAAITTYAGSAGHIMAISRGFALGADISYVEATSEIRAEVEDPIYQMIIRSHIKNLRIGTRVSVEEVVCRIRARYDRRDFEVRKMPRLSPAGSTIRNLRIDDQIQEIKLPSAFTMDEQEEDAFLEGKLDDPARFFPDTTPTPFFVAGLGAIFPAEWTWKHPQEKHRQSLCMLRMALGGDPGVMLDVCCCGGDGGGWPPFGL